MKYSQIVKAFNSILVVDVFLCSACMPILGVYFSAMFAKEFDLSPDFELVLTALFSYFFASAILLTYSRRTRWQPQFSAQRFQYHLLQVRDLLNGMLSIFTLYSIGIIVQEIIEDGEIKSPPVGEGAGYVIIKLVLPLLHMDMDVLHSAKDLGLKFPQSEDPRETQRFEHGGEFMFWWALLASCVAKLTYFNSIFSIIRASEIFIDLNPKFNNDENDAASQEQNGQEQIIPEPIIQEPTILELKIQEPSIQEQVDEKDSELSIQFQQDEGSVK